MVPLIRIFQYVVQYFVNSNVISPPCGVVYVGVSRWDRSAGSHSSDCPLIAVGLFKHVLSAEADIYFPKTRRVN